MIVVTKLTDETVFSAEAQRRLREPRCRGMFKPIDAARRQLGLLSGGDDQGQCRLYCLVNLETKVIEDARFMAFGDLASHPIADALTELMREQELDKALSIKAEEIDKVLRDDTDSSFGMDNLDAYAFINSLQNELRENFPSVKLLPKPIEKEVYKRKREADWSGFDQRWFPLSLLKKISTIQKCIKSLINDKLKRQDIVWSIEGLHDDFQIVVKIDGVNAEEIPTLLRFMDEAVHEGIHPDLSVEEHQA